MVAGGWVTMAGGNYGFAGFGLLWVGLAGGDCGFAGFILVCFYL